MFSNSISVKVVTYKSANNGAIPITYSIEASNNNVNWENISGVLNFDTDDPMKDVKIILNNKEYYRYWRFRQLTSRLTSNTQIAFNYLQFYGRLQN